jgi:capsular polysaccharide biosynthesis protein
MESNQVQAAVQPERAPTIADVLAILWRWRWAIVAMTVVGVVAAGIYTFRQTKIYEAQASALIQRQSLANSLNNILAPGAQVNEGPRAATAQAQLATSPVIAQRTIDKVPGAGLTVGELLSSITVEPDPNSDVLHFKLQNESGAVAVRVVNVYAAEYVIYSTELSKQNAVEAARTVRTELRRLSNTGRSGTARYQQLDRNLDSLQSLVSLTTPTAQVINTATGYDKVKPKFWIQMGLGLLLGLGLGIGLTFVLEALDPRMRTAEAIAAQCAMPLLARLPKKQDAAEPVTLRGRDDASIEAYRVLLAATENVAGSPLRGTILVTSDNDPEAASAVAVNLAVASARAGHATTLVDLGFASPVLSRMLGAEAHIGIADAISGAGSLRDAEMPIKAGVTADDSVAPLRFLPAGASSDASSSLIGSDAAKSILANIADSGNVVIVDTGATAGASGAVSVASVADHTLLVGSTDTSRPKALDDAKRSIALGRSAAVGVAVYV